MTRQAARYMTKVLSERNGQKEFDAVCAAEFLRELLDQKAWSGFEEEQNRLEQEYRHLAQCLHAAAKGPSWRERLLAEDD